MKTYLFILSFLMICLSGYSQTDTAAVDYDNFTYVTPIDRATIIEISNDTLTDEDTLFFGVLDTIVVGDDTTFIYPDTILTGSDTIQFDFPHGFGSAAAGMLILNTDTIVGYDDVTGFYRLFQAACADCDYVAIAASTAITAPGQFTKTFDLHLTRLRLVVWTTGDTGRIWGHVVIKPSSVTSD